MPPHTVSNDLKARIPVLYSLHYNVKMICTLLGIRKSLVYKTLRLHRHTGLTFAPPLPHTSQRRHLAGGNIIFIIAYMDKYKTAYLNELQLALRRYCNTNVSIPTLVRTL
jgi:hypothetical protein